MSPQLLHIVLTIAFVALIAWRMQARVRRLIGRQPLGRARSVVTLVVLPLLLGLLALAPHTQPRENSYLLVGIVLGVVLAFLGLRLTRFEVTAEGRFYTPNLHIGVALSVLLVVRLVWRFAGSGFTAPAGNGLTPLTMLLFGALAAYYCAYSAGLLWWASRARPLADSGPS
ncbi:MAG TPA: hypothetical protein VK695_10605 [Steroidobacteraceae bacterium]|nr:hypothetical protein [Steroidobacteraceae bacterium]